MKKELRVYRHSNAMSHWVRVARAEDKAYKRKGYWNHESGARFQGIPYETWLALTGLRIRRGGFIEVEVG